MLSPKQIGTICFALFSFVFTAPLFATDIPSSASTADCKNNPLQTYSGTSNLQANWSANTIQLHWYNGDDEIQNVPVASQSCVYDGTLTPPATIPTKTGYTFKGWRVKDVTCGLSHVDAYIDPDGDADHVAWQPINGSSGHTVAQAIEYEEIDPGTDHSSELSNGEWRIIFSYGTVKGMAKCSDTSGDYMTAGTPSNTNGQYCWCAATSYTPNGESACNVVSPLWVLDDDLESASTCAYDCAYYCALDLVESVNFRHVMFGVAGLVIQEPIFPIFPNPGGDIIK